MPTSQDHLKSRSRGPGAMDIDAVAALFRRNMAALVNERRVNRLVVIGPSRVWAA
jgi:hypothetical protein